jgi:hypothetical protein
MASIDLTDRSLIERTIAGALKSAIDAHGPITIENRASAAKRVYSALKQIANERALSDL